MAQYIMRNFMLLMITLLLNAVPMELSPKPITNAQNVQGKKGHSTNQPTAVYTKNQGRIKTTTAVYEKKLICITNTSELINATLLNSTARNSSGHGCHDSVNATDAAVSTSRTGPLTISDKLAITAFVFMLLIGTFGNAYVIYTFTITFKKRTVTETMLIYLAFVDFFASLINPVIFIYWITTRFNRWDFGIIGCKILPPVGPISTTASSAIIIIIFIDRYRSIVTPFKTRFSNLQAHIMCSSGILISVLFYSYYISALSLSPDGRCQVQQVNKPTYSIPNVVVTLLWDLAYIVIFIPTNIRIFTHLKLSRALQSDASYSRARRRGNRKAMRILLTVGVVFAILVFPKDILHLIFTISWMLKRGIDRSPALMTLNSWFKVLQVSNSCVNIFIYSKMHNRFRSEITKFFRRLLRRPAMQPVHETYEDKTNVSIDYSEGTNSGLLRRVLNDKIVKRLSPRFKRKVAYNEKGELDSITQSPRLQRSDGNGVGDSAKRRKALQRKIGGEMDSSNGNASIHDGHKKGDKRPLLNSDGSRNGHFNDEGFTRSADSNKEPQSQREYLCPGLMRVGNQKESREETGPLKLNYDAQGDEAAIQNGREVAKILECYKNSGITSRETHC